MVDWGKLFRFLFPTVIPPVLHIYLSQFVRCIIDLTQKSYFVSGKFRFCN
jgi:hypothetical protein